jgi:hypothetical protein
MDLKDPERIWMSKAEALAYVQRVFPTLTENSLVSCHNGDFTRGIPDDSPCGRVTVYPASPKTFSPNDGAGTCI